jgi:hypothetical protein
LFEAVCSDVRAHALPALIGPIASTRTEGIHLREVFRFPVEVYADRLQPTAPQYAVAASV